MAASPTSRTQRAIDAETAEGLYRHVTRVDACTYLVPGSEYLFYIVKRDGWTFICECRAAVALTPCRHAAAAWHTMIRDQAGKTEGGN